MTGKQIVVVVVATLTILSGLSAGVAVTGAAQSTTQDLSSCQVIDESGEYQLTADITNAEADACLDVQAENVTIDGNGYAIDGVDGTGAGVIVNGATVTNLDVTGFEDGFRLVAGGTVDGITATENANGVYFSQVGGTVTDSTLVENDNGVRTSVAEGTGGESSIVVQGSALSNNGNGANVFYSDVTFEDNVIENNAEDGVFAQDGELVLVENSIRSNGGSGLALSDSSAELNGDVIADNGELGIGVAGVIDATNVAIQNNGDDGLSMGEAIFGPSTVTLTDSTITGNDGAGISDEVGGTLTVSGSVIADNAGLGIDKTGEVADATGNYWGASDGPASATSEPLEDPETGALANGSGDAVSANASQSGVSTVQFDAFLTENPFTEDGDSDESEDDSEDSTDGDSGADDSDESESSDDEDSTDSGAEDGDDSTEDDSEESEEPTGADDDSGSSMPAYQIDVAAGDVIETLGDDAEDFYGAQGRLLQAQTVLADGTVTSTHMVPTGEVTKDLAGCDVTYTPVSYDADTGEATLSVSVDDDACEGVTLTVAGYELPGDDTTFVREHADGQELVASQTVTLDAGDSGTVVIDLLGDDAVDSETDGDAGDSDSGEDDSSADDSTDDSSQDESNEDDSGTDTESGSADSDDSDDSTDSESDADESDDDSDDSTEAAPTASVEDLAISSVTKNAPGDERDNLNGETVTITNTGDAEVDLSGVTLLYGVNDENQQTYDFSGGFTLGAGETVTVHTGSGSDDPTDVYLGSGNPVLDNSNEETLRLLAPNGDVIDERTE
jgi:hypothetical protein